MAETVNFDQDKACALPAGWKSGVTGRGSPKWTVEKDDTAPTLPNVLNELALSGAPDVIFFNAQLGRLYVAIGDPGVIDIVDTKRMRLIETIKTEAGAHTIGFDAQRNKIYAFLPGTHRAAVYWDQG